MCGVSCRIALIASRSGTDVRKLRRAGMASRRTLDVGALGESAEIFGKLTYAASTACGRNA